MDLRSIINSDSNSNPPPRPRPSLESPVKQIYQSHQSSHQSSYGSILSSFEEAPRPNTRPPQPPPLQPPNHRELQSPSGSHTHRSAQSPYQHTPTSSLSGSQYPFPQATHHQNQQISNHGPTFHPREQGTPIATPGSQGYGQLSPSMLTPVSTTPGSAYAYPQFQRPHSSHSSATPTSAQSHAQTFPRDSPHALGSHVNAGPHTYPSQQYQSQPGTPLGPPPSVSRPSPSLHRDSCGPSPYDYRGQGASGYVNRQVPAHSPGRETAAVLASPGSYTSRQPPLRSRSYLTDEERERSLSVSPKTRLPSQTKSELVELASEGDQRWSGGITPAKRKLTDNYPEAKSGLHRSEQHPNYYNHPSDSESRNGVVAQYANEQNNSLKDMQLPTLSAHSGSSQTMKEVHQLVPQANFTSGPLAVSLSRQQPHPPRIPSNQSMSMPDTPPTPPAVTHGISSVPASLSGKSSMRPSIESTVSPGPPASPQQPTRKRQRFDSPPIYAQSRKTGRVNSVNPFLPNRKSTGPRAIPLVKQETSETKDCGSYQPSERVVKEETNGHSTSLSGIVTPQRQLDQEIATALGPWEHNIINILPSDQLTKIVADFLFLEVVERRDVGAGPVGGGSVPGAVLEIEAKLGQLMDNTTNERLRLPVASECVVNKDNPNLRVSFKSSMTEAQHRTMNNFLNDAYAKSTLQDPLKSKPRIPMTYRHAREVDSFYELPQPGGLAIPESIRQQLNARHSKPRVRRTIDQREGRELAKIIKVRVADLDVYNPRCLFDWRLSVNLEINYEGDVNGLKEVMDGLRKAPERRKDRMVYRHLAYQIDLTQVTPNETSSSTDKEHELEIELSSAEVRKQGSFLKANQANGYEELVRGFVDNVRLLTRLWPI